MVDSEAEEAEDDDDEEEDEDEDEDAVEPGEISKSAKSAGESDDDDDEEADSDEEPDEAPIGKKSKQAETPQKGGIPKVIVGRIPPETPKDQILFVSNLPQGRYNNAEKIFNLSLYTHLYINIFECVVYVLQYTNTLKWLPCLQNLDQLL